MGQRHGGRGEVSDDQRHVALSSVLVPFPLVVRREYRVDAREKGRARSTPLRGCCRRVERIAVNDFCDHGAPVTPPTAD